MPVTKHGMPGAPLAMLPPLAISGASATWNGPSTVVGVAPVSNRLLIASTSMLTPITSENRMTSWRLLSDILPVRVIQSIAVNHSAFGRLDVAHEGVQVLDQRSHDLAQARIGNVLPALEHDVGQVFFGDVGHWLPLVNAPLLVAAVRRSPRNGCWSDCIFADP